MAQRMYNGKVVDEIYIANAADISGGGGGTGGSVGSSTDPIATDLTDASLTSVSKTTADSLLSFRGSKAGGTAASNSLLGGGIFRTAPPTLTDGQQAATQFDEKANIRVRLHGTASNINDGVSPAIVGTSGHADGSGGARPLATALFGYDAGSNLYNRLRMNGTKSMFVSVATPDTSAPAAPADVTVNGTTAATANMIIQVDNPGHRYKVAVIHITNLSTNAFSDMILTTKCNPADAAYDTTISGSTWASANKPYIKEVSTEPTILSNATVRIALDISLFTSLRISATVPSATPGTTARGRAYLLDV